MILKRIARTIVPAPIRRWLQKRKLHQQVAAYSRRVVDHQYGKFRLTVELTDPLAEGWYDHDWPVLPELALLSRHRLRTGARVFDLGAHQGVVGLMLANYVGRTGHVILVEPNQHNAAACSHNAALNRIDWITIKQAAVADQIGFLDLNAGLNSQAAELSDYAGVIRVPALTIDSLTSTYGPPDVVFLDVEGFECRALVGAAQALESQCDWMVEVHVGCGLEAAGASVAELLAYFPANRYYRFIHFDGDANLLPLDQVPAAKLGNRFFLTAIAIPDRLLRNI